MMKANEGRKAPALLSLLSTVLAAAGVAAQPSDPNTSSAAVQAAGDERAGDASSLRRTRDAFMLVGDFAAALAPAELLVDLLTSTSDPALPSELARLARIQAELEDFESAELSYLNAIELIQEAEGEFSITLMDPYQGLGRSYIKNRQFPEAVTALEQAQHISQRNLGLFNVTQTELIDDLTTANLGLGDTIEAQRLQLERLDNAIRRYGADDPQVIPFHYQLASYYDQSRMRAAAREQYELVVALAESRPDLTDTALLQALRRLMKIDLLLGDQEEARIKLLEALQGNPDIDPYERAESLAALGDWAIAHEDIPTAGDYYSEAYALLQQAPQAERDQVFGQPQMIDFVAPLSAVDRDARSRPHAWGTIVLQFDVSADGRASNVSTVSAMPPEIMDEAYNRRIREAHFRPRIVAGAPAATDNVQFTHHFRFYVADED